MRVDDADELPVLRTLLFKLDVPVFLCEQGMIPTDPDVDSGMKTRTALADDDVARDDLLATVNLYAKSFTLRITTVLGAAACFLVCHCTVPICFMTQDQPELR